MNELDRIKANFVQGIEPTQFDVQYLLDLIAELQSEQEQKPATTETVNGMWPMLEE